MVIQSQQIDNLMETLNEIESALSISNQPKEKEELVETLRLEVIGVLKTAFIEGDRTVRRSVVYGLSKIGLDKSLDFFIEALNDPDEHVRGWAAEALGRLRDPRSIIPLIKTLADENQYVCFNVAASLKYFQPDQVVNQLIRSLQDSDRLIRRRVCKLLGELKDQRTSEVMISLLKDEDPGVRYEAAEAIRKLKNLTAILPLISALNDPNFDVRAVAIMALGSFGDKRAIEPLIAMLVEQKDHRHVCIESLRSLCGEANLEPLFELIRASKRMISETSNIILERMYNKEDAIETKELGGDDNLEQYRSIGNQF